MARGWRLRGGAGRREGKIAMARRPEPTGRVIITGGSGKAGGVVLRDLVAHGYEAMNVDRVPAACDGARTLITDVTDIGQVFEALASYTGLNDMDESTRPQPVDAIVHFAGIARNMLVPDNEVFRINTQGTYNVLSVAQKLGIPKVILASSETIYGYIFSYDLLRPERFPLDEDYPVRPMDSYALSKVVVEDCGRAFAARGGLAVYALRISHVLTADEYETVVPAWLADSNIRKRSGWNFIDARDLAQAVRLCLAHAGEGFELLNIANDDIISTVPARQLLEIYYPGVPLTVDIPPFGALLSNARAKKVLGFAPEFNFEPRRPRA